MGVAAVVEYAAAIFEARDRRRNCAVLPDAHLLGTTKRRDAGVVGRAAGGLAVAGGCYRGRCYRGCCCCCWCWLRRLRGDGWRCRRRRRTRKVLVASHRALVGLAADVRPTFNVIVVRVLGIVPRAPFL